MLERVNDKNIGQTGDTPERCSLSNHGTSDGTNVVSRDAGRIRTSPISMQLRLPGVYRRGYRGWYNHTGICDTPAVQVNQA